MNYCMAILRRGNTLALLPDEAAVQKWVANYLRLLQGRSYSLEREPHVADEKEPDIRFRAKASDASIAVEIKVCETWTLDELEAALSDQLCGKYLRASNARHGILLLVHQKPREKGWYDKQSQKYLTFPQMIEHLKRLSGQISSQSDDCPQPDIAVLNVSSCIRQ